MPYDKQREDFAESKATLISYSNIPLTNIEQLVRGWKGVTDKEKATNVTFLNTYVSSGNTEAASTVTNPQADGSGTNPGGGLKNVYSGLWRHVSSNWNPENQMYVQTLRKGWAETVLSSGAPNDECMLQAIVDATTEPRIFGVYWRNIAADKSEACVAELRALGSFSNPTIQGETHSGAYSIGNIKSEQQEDGSYNISMELVRIASIASVADLVALGPSKEVYTHDVENPFGVLGWYTDEKAGRKPRDSMVRIYRAISSDSVATLRGFSDAALLGLLSEGFDRTNYKTIQTKIDDDVAGSVKFSVAWQYIPLNTSISEATARYVKLERKNQSNKIIITIAWPRIDPAYIKDISETVLFCRDTVTDPTIEGKTYSGDYFVKTTIAPMSDSDAVVIEQTLTKSGDQELDIVIGSDPDHIRYEFYRWDISANDIQTFMDDATFKWEIPENGITKAVKVSKNEDESFYLYAVYSTTKDLEKNELTDEHGEDENGPVTIRDNYLSSSERHFGWNIPIADLPTYSAYFNPETEAVNVKYSFQISRQTEHVFDFVGTKETLEEWNSDTSKDPDHIGDDPSDGVSGSPIVSYDGALEIRKKIYKNIKRENLPEATRLRVDGNGYSEAASEVEFQDNGNGAFDAVVMLKTLKANGDPDPHVAINKQSKSEMDWDVKTYQTKTPTWGITVSYAPSEEDGPYVTGYNAWQVEISRYRVITTLVTRTLWLEEPDITEVTAAAPTLDGETGLVLSGSGVSRNKVANRRGDGLWEVVESTVTSGSWQPYGGAVFTFLYYMDTVDGTGA